MTDIAAVLARRLAEHRAHLERLSLPAHGIEEVIGAFAGAPVRSPKGGPTNVVSRAALRKPGVSNDTEALTLEFEYLYELEANPVVHQYRTQALALTVHPEEPLVGGGVRRHGWVIHPDVLVIEDGRVVARDLMREDELAASATTRPWYIFRDPEDPTRYRCPSAEVAAAALGIAYEIRSSAQHNRLRTRGLRYLYDFIDHPIPAAARDQMVGLVERGPGVTVAELIDAGRRDQSWTVDEVLAMLAQRLLFIDLDRHTPDDQSHARVYRDATTARAFHLAHPPSWAIGGQRPKRASILPGTLYALGDRRLEVFISTGDEIHFRLIDDAGHPHVIYRRDEFERMVAGSILVETGADDLADIVRQIVTVAWLAASPAARATARARWRAVEIHRTNRDLRRRAQPTLPLPFIEGSIPSATSLDRWHAKSLESDRLFGDVLLGLLPKPRTGRPGLRKPGWVEAIIDREIDEYYANGMGRSQKALVRKIQGECERVSVGERPDRKTVLRRLKQRDPYRLRVAHDGSAIAYADKPYAPVDPDAMPPRGSYPFQRAQYDTTIADIEVVDEQTGRPIGRPVSGRLVDSLSDAVLTRNWEFGAPRVGGLLACLLDCAERYGRLPEELVLDNALEHWSTALQVFAAAHGMHVLYRPVRQGRWGGPVELSFQRLTDGLLHQLPGNTRAMKLVRQVTEATDAKTHALLTLADLDYLVGAFDDAADSTRIVRETGVPPKEALTRGIIEHGSRYRRHVVVDDLFRIRSLVPSGSRKARGTKGIELDNLTYQHDCFSCPGVKGASLDVAGDHRDITRIWTFVPAHQHGATRVAARWVEGRCRLLARLRVVSERELDLATQAARERLRDDNRKRVDFDRAIAEVLLDAEKVEGLALERKRTRALAEVRMPDRLDVPSEQVTRPGRIANPIESIAPTEVGLDAVAAAQQQISARRYGTPG